MNFEFINNLSYDELLVLKQKIEEVESKFYKLTECYIVQDQNEDFHLCEVTRRSNYSFMGSSSIIELSDIFSERFIAFCPLYNSLPRLENVLTEKNIEHTTHYKKEELKKIWDVVNEKKLLDEHIDMQLRK